jgi:hypothetical protein
MSTKLSLNAEEEFQFDIEKKDFGAAMSLRKAESTVFSCSYSQGDVYRLYTHKFCI